MLKVRLFHINTPKGYLDYLNGTKTLKISTGLLNEHSYNITI